MLYRLNDDETVTQVTDPSKCTVGKRILLTHLKGSVTKNTITVSTVFLGIDHNWSRSGDPILFETMVFGLDDDKEVCFRSSSIEEIKQIHYRACSDYINNSYKYISGDTLPGQTLIKDSEIDLF